MENYNFEYTFAKSELTSEVIFIIHVNPNWIEKDMDIEVKDKEIKLTVENQEFNSGKLPYIVESWLKSNEMKIYFATNDGEIILETTLGGY